MKFYALVVIQKVIKVVINEFYEVLFITHVAYIVVF